MVKNPETEALKYLDRALAQADATLAKFAAGFASDAFYALDWAGAVFEAAAVKRVFGRARAYLASAPGATVDELVADLNDEVLRAARSPERSTSPCANELKREVLRAQAELLDRLAKPVTRAAQVQILQRAIEGGAFDVDTEVSEEEALALVEGLLGEPLLPNAYHRLRERLPLRLRDVAKGRSWRTFLAAERARFFYATQALRARD